MSWRWPATPSGPGCPAAYRSLPLGPELAAGARVVLVQAPKGLDALREIAEVVAASARTRRHRARRRPGQAHDPRDERRPAATPSARSRRPWRGRSRGCWSPGAAAGPSSFPRCQEHADLGLTVCAHGAAFAGTKIDIGTRALLALPGRRMAPRPARRWTSGCGTGVLAAALARAGPALDRARRRPVRRGGRLGDRDRGGERPRRPDPGRPGRRRGSLARRAASTSSSAIRRSTSARPS